MPPADGASDGAVFHCADVGNVVLPFEDAPDVDLAALSRNRGHRAIGVAYHPERGPGDHARTTVPELYDAFVHVDETAALHSLHAESGAVDPRKTCSWGV